MKKILLFITLCLFINAKKITKEAKEDIANLADFTPQVSLRSAFSGDVLVTKNTRLNWIIKEITLDEKLKKKDPYADKFKLGFVQFVNPNNSKLCLGIDESGFFKEKSCEEDLKNSKLETVFSIIPTSTGAVQIRSLIKGGDQCITQFDNPNLRGRRGFGINTCDIDRLFDINLRNLIFILPPIQTSTIVTP